jgi:spore coat protein U-like protein
MPVFIRSLMIFVFLESMAVTAPFAQECAIMTTGLNWGIYDQLQNLPTYGEGSLRVTCDRDFPYAILLDAGQHSGGSFSPRKMQNGGRTLEYYLFTDGAQTKPWGDGKGGSYVQAGAGSGTYPIFGVIPPRQNVPVGSYADAVIITVQW